MKFRNIIKSMFASALAASILFFGAPSLLRAEGSPSVLAMRSSDDGVYIYTVGDPISDMEVQIGDTLTSVEPVDVPIRTIFLIDNSISTYEALVKHGNTNNATRQESLETALPGNIEGDSLVPFLHSIVDGREEGEQFRIGIFNDSINLFWACDWTSDYDLVNSVINSISYADNTTSVSNALYDAIASVENDGVYTRIILISDCVNDGLDNRGFGEFSALEENRQVSIYVVGISRNNNSDDIANILEISHTAPRYANVITSDGSNLSDIYGTLNADHLIQAFRATPDGNVFTGSEYGVLVNMTTEFGEYSATGSVIMPILAVTPTPIPSATPTPSPIPSATPTPTPEEEPEEEVEEVEEEPTVNVGLMSFLVVMVLAVIGGIGYYFINDGFKKKKKTNTLSVVPNIPENEVEPVPEKKKKKLVSVFKEGKGTTAVTQLVDVAWFYVIKGGAGFTSGEYNKKYFNNAQILIGSSDVCDIVINEGTIGQKHCIISCREGQFFLKDLGNANPTKLNGIDVDNTEVKMPSGAILDIGREQFRVDFKTEEKRV